MDFIFIVLMISAVLVLAGKLNRPQNQYKRTLEPTWKETKREAYKEPLKREQPNPFDTQRKTAPDGFRYDVEGEWPFIRSRIISQTEQILFERLKEALPEYHIFTQVQLSQLVTIKKGHSFKMWFSRINQMSIDFVVIDNEFNTVAAIELDDKSHYSDEDRHKADSKKDKVLTAAGIRVIRWRCEIMPSAEQISLAFPECTIRTS